MADKLASRLLIQRLAPIYERIITGAYDPDQDFDLLDAGITQAEMLNDPLTEAYAKNILGAYYVMQEQYTDAIDIYHEVAERYADGEDWEQYVYAHNNIGTTYEKMGESHQAIQAYQNIIAEYNFESVELIDVEVITALMDSVVNLGVVYVRQAEWAMAEYTLKQAIALFGHPAVVDLQREDLVDIVHYTYTLLSRVCLEQNELQAAWDYNDDAWDMVDQFQSSYLAVASFLNEIRINVHHADQTSAEENWHELESYLAEFDEGELTVSTPYYVAFAEYYLNKQQLEWAERHIERAVEALTLLKDEVSLANLQPLIEKIRNS